MSLIRPGTLSRTEVATKWWTVECAAAAVFRGVQAAGCEHQPRVTGGGKGSCETPGLSWVNTLLGNVKRAIDGTYHAC